MTAAATASMQESTRLSEAHSCQLHRRSESESESESESCNRSLKGSTAEIDAVRGGSLNLVREFFPVRSGIRSIRSFICIDE